MRRDLFEGVQLAVVGAYRNDEIGQKRGEALREAAGRTLDIERLDRGSAELIVREMLGIPEGRSPILEDVLSDAQGNPFFLTEYMRTALAQGWLRRGRTGEWTLQAPGRDALLVAQKLPLPESVKVLFRRRLADLDAHTRGVLLAAAVLGGEVPFCCLRDVSPEMPPERLLDALDDLCERQILESRPQGSAFTHDKIRETVLDLTPEEDKRRAHLRAAVCLEAHRGRRDHPPVADEALGHHFAAGGEPARALVHLDRAGDTAFRSGARRAAAEIFGRVLGDDGEGRRPPDPVPRGSDTWRRKQGEARFAVGDVEGCIEDSKAALALLGHPVPASGPGWTLRVVAGLAMVLLVGTLARLRRPGARATDRLEAARSAGQLASSYYFTLDLTPMLAVLLWGLLWAWRSGRAELVIEAQARLAYIAGVAGLPRLARALFAHAGKLAVHKDHRAARARALYLEALHGLGLGDWKRVVTLAGSRRPRCSSSSAICRTPRSRRRSPRTPTTTGAT